VTDKQELLDQYEVINYIYEKDKAGTKIKKPVGLNCPKLAQMLMYSDNENYLVTRDNQEILRYNGSFYENNADCIIENKINYYIDELTTNKIKAETIGFIKSNGYVLRESLDQPLHLINLRNGIYDINTGKLFKHDPKYTFQYELPIDYVPDADCPIWKKFITDISYQEDGKFLQELCGYLLYRRYTWALIVILLGHGRNGKTTFINVISYLLGEKNVEHIPLLIIAHERFAKAKLYQKHANMCSEIGARDIKDTGTIKDLTGRDMIFARDLYQKGFNFRNYAKLIFACNTLPDIGDRTLAMSERIAVVEFPNTFKRGTEECDPDLLDKLTTPAELSGILNWMIEGLNRLLKNKKFSPYRDFDNVSEYLKASQDPVNMFVERFITPDPDGEVQKELVYNAYLDFAKDEKYPTLISAVFTKKFKPVAPRGLSEGQPRAGGHKPTWKGIRLADKQSLSQTTPDSKEKKKITDYFADDKNADQDGICDENDKNDEEVE
jgi:putative DNA primase/helicase